MSLQPVRVGISGSYGGLIAHIDRAWDIHGQLRQKISERLPPLQERARATNRIVLHALAGDVVTGPTTRGVVFETKSGPLVITARIIVDCTGDGDMAARAGAGFEVGREEDGLTQPMTLLFRMVEFQYEAFERYAQEHPGQWRGVYGLWELIQRATAAGALHLPREDMLFKRLPPGQAYDIPLRALIPRDVDCLLVGGTHEANSSCRSTPTSMSTGQAAGACAALAVRLRRSPRDVPFQQVQAELLRQGANLGQVRSESG